MKRYFLLLLILPIVMAMKVEIYSDYTTHPSFVCPQDAESCELYILVDAMNRNVTPPKLVKECHPGLCRHVNDVGSSFGFRVLPGDVSFGAGLFKGYKIIEDGDAIEDGDTVATTVTTTTALQTTTTLSCLGKPFLTCKSLEHCVWYGNPVNGYCSFSAFNLTATKQDRTTTSTTAQVVTTTTIFSCLTKGHVCFADGECCSLSCQKRCLNPSILGICIFGQYISRCQ
jgi:hypothetical protein